MSCNEGNNAEDDVETENIVEGDEVGSQENGNKENSETEPLNEMIWCKEDKCCVIGFSCIVRELSIEAWK